MWTSSNGGASWTQVSAAAPWAARDSLSWAYSNGVHVIFGGTQEGGYGAYYGDLWTSTDDGATWLLLANNTAAGAFSNTALIFDLYGFLYMFGGETSIPGSQYQWSAVEARSTVQLAPSLLTSSSSSSAAGAAAQSSSTGSAAAVVSPQSSSSGLRGNSAATTHAAIGLTLALLLAAAMPILL